MRGSQEVEASRFDLRVRSRATGLHAALGSHQFGQAPLGEDPAGTGQVQVSGDPAAHVEPVHGASGRRAVLPVQQHQLLLGAHRAAFQHALQLEGKASNTEFFNIPSSSSEWF